MAKPNQITHAKKASELAGLFAAHVSTTTQQKPELDSTIKTNTASISSNDYEVLRQIIRVQRMIERDQVSKIQLMALAATLTKALTRYRKKG